MAGKFDSILQKISKYDLSLQNICSYVSLFIMRKLSGLWGIFALRLKGLLFGLQIGAKVECCGSVIIARWPGSRIIIGDGASLISSSRRATASTINAPLRLRTFGKNACIKIAEGVQLSGTSITVRSTSISIGKNTMIAPNCILVDSDFHAHWPPERRHLDPGLENDAPITIGDNVWIGMNSIILKGVNIGDGAIIGAGSVVTRDIPSLTLTAGNPAKIIKKLLPPQCGIDQNMNTKYHSYVLLDRDGTIIVDGHYPSDAKNVQLLPKVVEGLQILQKAGYGLIVVTNQSGIGRGYYSEADMHAINDKFKELLQQRGVNIAAIYFCPHDPAENCICRKPKAGMALKAAEDFGLNLETTFVIGDKACDIDLGLAVKAKGILVLTGYGQKESDEVKNRAAYVANDLEDAANWIVDGGGAGVGAGAGADAAS